MSAGFLPIIIAKTARQQSAAIGYAAPVYIQKADTSTKGVTPLQICLLFFIILHRHSEYQATANL